MPWRAVQNEALPPLSEGEQLEVRDVELHQGKTSAPDHLTEAELIGLMVRGELNSCLKEGNGQGPR